MHDFGVEQGETSLLSNSWSYGSIFLEYNKTMYQIAFVLTVVRRDWHNVRDCLDVGCFLYRPDKRPLTNRNPRLVFALHRTLDVHTHCIVAHTKGFY